MLLREIPQGLYEVWTPFLRRAFQEIKRRRLLRVSAKMDLKSPPDEDSVQEDCDGEEDVELYTHIALPRIPDGVTIPIPNKTLPEGTVVMFPHSVPDYYGLVFEMNGAPQLLCARV